MHTRFFQGFFIKEKLVNQLDVSGYLSVAILFTREFCKELYTKNFLIVFRPNADSQAVSLTEIVGSSLTNS